MFQIFSNFSSREQNAQLDYHNQMLLNVVYQTYLPTDGGKII